MEEYLDDIQQICLSENNMHEICIGDDNDNDDDYLYCRQCSDIVIKLYDNLCYTCKVNKYLCRECKCLVYYDDICDDIWCNLRWEIKTVTYMDGADSYGPKYEEYDIERRLSTKEFNNYYQIKYKKSLILERIFLKKLPNDLLKIIIKFVF